MGQGAVSLDLVPRGGGVAAVGLGLARTECCCELSHNRPRGPAMQTAGDADGLPPRARGPVEAEEEEEVITYHVMGAGVGAVRC